METIGYQLTARIPVIDDVDVLVIGAGPGGLCAAVAAARQGCKVALAEHYGCPGGMAGIGEISPFMPNHAGAEPLDKPIYLEWVNRMRTYMTGPNAVPTECKRRDWDSRTIGRYPVMLAAEDLLLEAGVKLYYHHTFFDTVRSGDRIDSVLFFGKSGLSAIKAKMVIDSTGDGDVAAKSGCAFEFGNADGYCQPMTLCFKLSHVDTARMPERKEISRLYIAAKERGEIDCPREDILMFRDFDNDVIHFNTTRVIKHAATNAEALSEAEIIARRQLRELLVFFRKYVPGFEECEIHSIATQIGVRESRRILGLEKLTIEAFDRQARYPDAIARVNYPVDIHNPNGSGTEMRHLGEDGYYEIPYGCIVPPAISNLLIGSRCISVDHALHSSMRVMPPVCSLGQAAGMAAALALKADTTPAKLDGKLVREALRAFGANI